MINYIDMEQENTQTDSDQSMMYYVIGAIVLVVIVGLGYLFRQKSLMQNTQTTTPIADQPQVQINTGPITKLACEKQYYNPVVGFAKYYLSAEGVDLPGAAKIDCMFSVSVDNVLVKTASSQGVLSENKDRGGNVFRCQTPQLELKPAVATRVDVKVKDDQKASTDCTATFLLPRP